MRKVKITVLKKEFYPSLAKTYLSDKDEAGPCPLLKEGDTFLFHGEATMPKGFCPWAWIDIYSGVSALSAGASYSPWYNREGMEIACCTDGIRPVVFLLEAVKEDS